MKERPIIMSSESVRAILDGRKTQTRRVVKPQPIGDEYGDWNPEIGIYAPVKIAKNGEMYPGKEVFGAATLDEDRVFPYGKPGDRLWVKETFHFYSMGGVSDGTAGVIWKADNEFKEDNAPDWQSPIFMPRRYSRLTLEITDERCERLQEITIDDGFDEGYQCEEFIGAWNQLNAKRGFPWDSNPYVWVITFKRIEQETKQ